MEITKKPRIVISVGRIIGIHSIEADQPVDILVVSQDKDTGEEKLLRWGVGTNNITYDNVAYVDKWFRLLEEQEKRGYRKNEIS